MAIFIVVFGLLAAIAAYFAIQLVRAFRRFRMPHMQGLPAEVPSVSVCIPARNETHAMTQCLERVLASDYEKLEVIVFDDNSSDDTSVLVRSFAHAGVRFVAGEPLPPGWLGKNHALAILAREASGTYVVFLDVDTAIKPTTISQLIGYTVAEKAKMVSVIPRRNDTWRVSVLFGPLRYFWELVLSRKNFPASSSSLWMIARDTLLSTLGGIDAYKTDVLPETSIAAKLGAVQYRCLLSNNTLGVAYEKRWSSQVETSRRLLYPMLGKKGAVGAVALLVLTLLNVPFFVLLSGFIVGWTTVQTLAALLLVAFMLLFAAFAAWTWQSRWWLGALLWPIVIFQEFILLIYSIVGYAKGTITWKGRSIKLLESPIIK
jgi:glycosyltransferase involved in cell wall biosynthesis